MIGCNGIASFSTAGALLLKPEFVMVFSKKACDKNALYLQLYVVYKIKISSIIYIGVALRIISLIKSFFCGVYNTPHTSAYQRASASHKDKETITPSPMPNVFF